MEITVNGVAREVSDGLTLLALVESLSVRKELIAVEINRDIVRKHDYADRKLRPGDRIEIVEFVGGG